MKKNNTWFSIIEILIWIFIFTMWLVSIYALIISTMKMNDYSKNSIVASNLARETIENVRNLRDSNYKKLFKWNKLPWSDVNNLFSTWNYYKIENDFDSVANSPLKFDIISNFWEWQNELNAKMQNYKLCLNSLNQYTYDCNWLNTSTYFYRYAKFDDVVFNSWWVNTTLTWALKLTSKVIWYNRWYHEVELNTILTDFLRQ